MINMAQVINKQTIVAEGKDQKYSLNICGLTCLVLFCLVTCCCICIIDRGKTRESVLL